MTTKITSPVPDASLGNIVHQRCFANKTWCVFATCIGVLALSGFPRVFGQDTFLNAPSRVGTPLNATRFVIRPDGVRTPLNPTPTPVHLPAAVQAHTVQRIAELQALGAQRPEAVSLIGNQTPIRDQGDRGTCGIFAATAALEAAYKRKHGLTLDLSEQYFFHSTKSSTIDYPRVFQYENQSSFWGGVGSQVLAYSTVYPLPTETHAPYLRMTSMTAIRDSISGAGLLAWNENPVLNTVTQGEVDAFEYSPKYVPTSAQAAAIYGAQKVTLLGKDQASSTDILEMFLANHQEVAIDVALNWKTTLTDVLAYNPDSTNGPGHAMLLVAYDRRNGIFTLKNSWGGDKYVHVTYEFIRKSASSGAVVDEVVPPSGSRSAAHLWQGVWNMDHDGWRGKLIIRRVHDRAAQPAVAAMRSAPIRLGHYMTADGKLYPLNGYFEDMGRTLLFQVHPEQDPPPGANSGQQWFKVFLFSRDLRTAAGVTYWNEYPFGVHLTREAINTLPAMSSFHRNKWVGRWSMNHDGWKGRLYIDGIGFGSNPDAVIGRYQDQSGEWRPLHGNIASDKPSIALIVIDMGSGNFQPFSLYYHLRDEGRFSGVTTWAGFNFGVTAVRE